MIISKRANREFTAFKTQKNGRRDRLTSTSEFVAELVVLWSELLCCSFTKLCKSLVSSLEMCVALLSGAFGSLSYSGEGAILKEEQSDDKVVRLSHTETTTYPVITFFSLTSYIRNIMDNLNYNIFNKVLTICKTGFIIFDRF